MNIKFLIQRLPNITVYYLSFKKYYLCDECKHIHKINDDAMELNNIYGLFINNNCANKVIIEACNIITKSIFKQTDKTKQI